MISLRMPPVSAFPVKRCQARRKYATLWIPVGQHQCTCQEEVFDDKAIGRGTALRLAEVVFAERIEIDCAIDVIKDLVEDDLAADICWRAAALQETVELVREQAPPYNKIQQAPVGIFQRSGSI